MVTIVPLQELLYIPEDINEGSLTELRYRIKMRPREEVFRLEVLAYTKARCHGDNLVVCWGPLFPKDIQDYIRKVLKSDEDFKDASGAFITLEADQHFGGDTLVPQPVKDHLIQEYQCKDDDLRDHNKVELVTATSCRNYDRTTRLRSLLYDGVLSQSQYEAFTELERQKDALHKDAIIAQYTELGEQLKAYRKSKGIPEGGGSLSIM